MSYTPVVIILGAGKRVGNSVADLFAQKGYKVAIAARSLQNTLSDDGRLHIKADLTDDNSVDQVFDTVSKKFGPASVVVHNAAAVHAASATAPLDVDLADFQQDLALNTTSLFVAAKRAVQEFKKLPANAPKTFIYTGNLLNTEIMPRLLTLGMGKSASAHLIAVASEGYASDNCRFYYADERKADGGTPLNNISGDAHASFYYELAQDETSRPWLQTFVPGQGYTDFRRR